MRISSLESAGVEANTAKGCERGVALKSASESLRSRGAPPARSAHAATIRVDTKGDVSVTTPNESGNKYSIDDRWAQSERSQFAAQSAGIGGVFSGTIGVIAAVVVAAGI